MKLRIKSRNPIIAAFLFFSLNTLAIELVKTNQFNLADEETLTEETWLSAQSVNLAGVVSNDLFAATQSANLSGRFFGDIWCISVADSIQASGTFYNGVRLASKTIQLAGTINGPVTAAGTTVKINQSARLMNGLLCLGDHAIIEGNITGPVRIFAQRATLGGKLNGNVSITAQEIVVLPGTVINGDLTYTAPDDLVLPASVTLNGTLHKRLSVSTAKSLLKDNLTGHFLFGLAALVTGLVFSAIFPGYTGTATHILKTSPGLCALTGFAALVMIPLTAFLMLFTVIGFPLSILLLLFYLILLYLAKIIVGLWIGSLILRRNGFEKRRMGGPLALGLLVLYSMTIFTATSYPITLLIIILGLGTLVLSLFKKPVLIIKTKEASEQQTL